MFYLVSGWLLPFIDGVGTMGASIDSPMKIKEETLFVHFNGPPCIALPSCLRNQVVEPRIVFIDCPSFHGQFLELDEGDLLFGRMGECHMEFSDHLVPKGFIVMCPCWGDHVIPPDLEGQVSGLCLCPIVNFVPIDVGEEDGHSGHRILHFVVQCVGHSVQFKLMDELVHFVAVSIKDVRFFSAQSTISGYWCSGCV